MEIQSGHFREKVFVATHGLFLRVGLAKRSSHRMDLLAHEDRVDGGLIQRVRYPGESR